ncbi:MAG: phosphoribosylglycinamide formyltransferase [Candidatus Altiarchaeales archaeon HGW-Altiarchaeales-3]|nr:MAG: phosphoribosylglycinamide formyltransferase [Candidatus Altiarchaeales archaeon HGW-Altiarchaeales-3]
MTRKLKLGILASTSGTDLQAIINAIESVELNAEISVVISNKEDAYALERARNHKIFAVFIDPSEKTREEFDRAASKELDACGVELILLIGYMRYMSPWFVQKYKNKIMNVHPSLLPAFAGGMDMNVHKEILDWGCKVSGCTIHFVDEGADTGPIIIQKAIPLIEGETVNSLRKKVQDLEGKAFVEAIRLFGMRKLNVEGRIVRIL